MKASRHRSAGFTLIEVMIALLIAGVGMVAVIDAVNKYAASQSELELKLVADWVAGNTVAQVRLDAKTDRVREGRDRTSVEMGGLDWRVSTELKETDVEQVFLLSVEVRLEDDPSDRVISRLTSALSDVQP